METSQTNHIPKVSVIMPAYNTAPWIGNSLESVFAQTFQDFEVIVVNDGSPDTIELEQVLQQYRDRIVYIRQENKRAAGARNTAIRAARGQFMAFLDSDDSWFPDHLASQMQLFEQDPKLDMVYGNAIMLGDPKQCEFMEKCPSAGSPTFAAMVVEQCQISLSTVVARKPALVDAGLFDEKLLRCDDYDMWLRVAFRGAKIAYTRNVQARLNGGRPGSLGQSRAKMAEGYWIILEKAIRSLPLSTSEQALVRNRAAVIRTRFLMEEGKSCLGQGRFDKAKELFAEANQDLRKNKIRLTVLGLSIAPKMTSKLFFLWTRMRDGAPA